MAFVDDTLLILKKILVTVLIYSVPVTIIVGGLLLTKHFLIDKAPKTETQATSTITETKP